MSDDAGRWTFKRVSSLASNEGVAWRPIELDPVALPLEKLIFSKMAGITIAWNWSALLAQKTGSDATLWTQTNLEVAEPTLSPDGADIISVIPLRDERSGNELRRWRLATGQALPSLHLPCRFECSMLPARDKNWIVLQGRQDHMEVELWVLEYPSGRIVRHWTNGDGWNFSGVLSRGRVALRSGAKVDAVDPLSNRRDTVGYIDEPTFGAVTWLESGDDGYLLAATARTGIPFGLSPVPKRANPTTHFERFDLPSQIATFTTQLSPNSHWVAGLANWGGVVWDTSTRKVDQEWPLFEDNSAQGAAISPDGNKLALLAKRRLLIIDLAEGSHETVSLGTTVTSRDVGKLIWLRDGPAVYFQSTNELHRVSRAESGRWIASVSAVKLPERLGSPLYGGGDWIVARLTDDKTLLVNVSNLAASTQYVWNDFKALDVTKDGRYVVGQTIPSRSTTSNSDGRFLQVRTLEPKGRVIWQDPRAFLTAEYQLSRSAKSLLVWEGPNVATRVLLDDGGQARGTTSPISQDIGATHVDTRSLDGTCVTGSLRIHLGCKNAGEKLPSTERLGLEGGTSPVDAAWFQAGKKIVAVTAEGAYFWRADPPRLLGSIERGRNNGWVVSDSITLTRSKGQLEFLEEQQPPTCLINNSVFPWAVCAGTFESPGLLRRLLKAD
jgi:hypothetical protein